MENFLSEAIVSVFLSPPTQISPWLGDQTYLVCQAMKQRKEIVTWRAGETREQSMIPIHRLFPDIYSLLNNHYNNRQAEQAIYSVW